MTKGAKVIVAIIGVLILIWAGYAIYISSKNEISATNQASVEPIKIGLIAPLTGDYSEIGLNAKAAAEIAIDEINKSGGVLNRQIKLVAEDGKCDADQSVTASAKLINVDRVSVILGGACNDETRAAAPIADASRIPMLSYCSTSDRVSALGDFIFRNIPKESSEIAYAASYIATIMKRSKIALVHEKSERGMRLGDTFEKNLSDSGGKIVARETYDYKTSNFKPILSKVDNARPEVLYFIGDFESSIAVIKQATNIKTRMQFFGTSSLDNESLGEKLDKFGDGTIFSLNSTKSSSDFKQLMSTKLSSDKILACSNYAYDGIKILSGVMAQAGTDGTSIKDALYKVHYTGGLGQATYDFDDNGDPSEPVYLIKIVKNGTPEIYSPDSIDSARSGSSDASTTTNTGN